MKTIRDAIVIVLIATALGIVVNMVRNAAIGGGLAWNTQWKDNRKFSGEIEIPPSYQPGDSLLSLKDAFSLYTGKKAIFLDAREPVDYIDGHITGAINFPFDHWDDFWERIRPQLDSTREIVAYCGGLDCELSLFLSRQLKEQGYQKAYIFFGGWEKWRDASLPTETSAADQMTSDNTDLIIPIILGAYILLVLIITLIRHGGLRKPGIIFFSRLILGGLFIYASFDKVLNPLAFAQIIHNYRIMSPNLINLPAMVVPWIEFLAGFMLIIGLRVRGADLVIGGLLVFYICLLAITTSRGINVTCGCFSTAAGVKSDLALRIVEDVGMLLLSLHILIFYKTRRERQKAV